ncbi:MAG: peptidylprolyl isomerase [Chromatiaceae bacterium]|nr:peptidylprolyl isomerase [Chromatiaceae bacterium]
MKYLSAASLCALTLFAATVAVADQSSVIAAYGDTVLRTDELAAEVHALPAASRERFAKSARSRDNLVVDLLVRRQVAARARQEGIADDPAVRYRLQLLEERLLYEVYMQRAEAAMPDEAVIERMARDEYRAHRERYVTPEAVRASHILLRVNAKPGEGRDHEQAMALARELLDRLKAGADFAQLAKEYSEDPGSARKGGDLGFFEKDRMVKPFAEAAFALRKPGDLSGIVETQFGLHIIRLTERRPAGQRSFDEVRDELVASNRTAARNKVRLDVIEPLRDPARLKIDEAALEAVFAPE